MKIPLPLVPTPEIEPPDKFLTLPPARRSRPSRPEIEPVLLTMPGPPSAIPLPPEAATIPAFAMVHVVPDPPSMPSADPVEVTVPVLVMTRGSSEGPRTTGPDMLLLIVLAIGLSSKVAGHKTSRSAHGVAGRRSGVAAINANVCAA